MIDPTKLTEGTAVWLLEDVKDYKKGTGMIVQKVMPMANGTLIMLRLPEGNARAIGARPEQITDVNPAAPAGAPQAPQAQPVADLFTTFAPMTEEVALNFMGDYMGHTGPLDTSLLEAVMANVGVEPGEEWTPEQTAKMYLLYAEMIHLPEPPSARALVPTVTAEKPPAEQAKAKRTRSKSAAGAAAEEKHNAAAAPVDRTTFTALQLDAMTLAGAMMPIYAQCPANFDDVVVLAAQMVQAAAEVEPS